MNPCTKEGSAPQYPTENVNHPKHYDGSTSLECIEVMTVCMGYKAVANFCLCNALKYLWRYKNKNGAEDIKKAGWYLDWIEKRIASHQSFDPSFIKQFREIRDLYRNIKNKL